MYVSNILSLPSTVVLLLCATSISAESPWPHNLPKHMKYFPEDEVHVKRALDIRDRLQTEKPVGMKKMSLDEGEMFMLDNWIFAPSAESRNKRSDGEGLGNRTCQARSPLRPHEFDNSFLRFQARNALLKRQFQCPDNTASCSSIGAPDVCCGTGLTCMTLDSNSGAGSVGCCPQGRTCAGSVSCDTSSGYSSCPDASNGGCCMPGFQCSGVGCVAVGTSVVYVQPSTSTSSSASTSAATSAPASSTTAAVVSTTSSSSSSSSTRATSAYTCSTGWFSCAASLGGGCCQNGRACATGASCLGTDSSTQAPSAPVRPTSLSITTTQVTSAIPGNDVCPSGFYVCSAYLPSGCCRVGRDCQTTGSCAKPTETVLASNGVTVLVPSGATAAAEGGSCPSSWYSCAAAQGGNCCPNGYACGDQCTATASGQSGVQNKVTPSAASFVSEVSICMMISAAFAVGFAMIAL
ncbi:hypothetical protein P153DRAFT_60659 [Dothidotthia symphoricarpi CBS 119687]|uniref:GPI anchored protein n=1 Tax=Dothidotthia symphoricarpi CBS 119687 TaxID=1392245 RepID=A0A6A6A6H3_9PLEO|nr:uncharacterized protein P153DRAFT_60659 [Dothidotthia symphoricarpi CBS 119687]KAF2127156.1 hypothetical protein P153DRAFT_60659 [Dothidotthia symphoricarpi CBS 119687]